MDNDYLKDGRWRCLVSYGEQRAAELSVTEADIPRLIAEARDEHRRELLGAEDNSYF